MLTAVERELERWEWRARLAQRPLTELGGAAADLLRAEREHRQRAVE